MISFRCLLIAAALALFAACCSGDVLSLSSYDTSCQHDSDCIAVFVGTLGCCSCPNAAINKADEAQYQADTDAAKVHRGGCVVDCVSCEAVAPVSAVCVQGTCGISSGPDGGVSEGGTVSCGTITCGSAEVCVSDQLDGVGQPMASFHCAPVPQACGTGLSCACSQSLCDTGYTCQQASAGLVQCSLMGP